MKIAKKLTALAVSSLMMFSMAGITASAATVTQDGLNVSLTTDKTEYKKDEAITATLTVENTGGTSVKDVKLENIVPEGYELAKDYSLTKSVDELKSNDKAELKVVYNAKTGGNVTPSNNNTIATTATGASVDTVKTGDSTNAVIFAIILLISIGVGILCFKKKKGKEFLSIALCVSVLGTIIAVVPFEANAANSQMKSISIEDVINIDGNKVTVKASVPYSHEDTEYGEIYSYPIEEEHVHETADGTKYLDNEILVVVKDGITRQQVDELAKKYDSVVVGAITVSGDYQLKLNNMVSNEELIKLIDNIGQESIIDSCSLNYIEVYSSDTIDQWAGFYYGDEWKSDLQNNSDAKGKSWGIEAINTFAAWKQLTDNSNNVNPVKVGVVDGGFDSTHPDLGFRDLYYENGKNKVSSNAKDKNHGTHVSGTFAANTNDNTGICGVYPYSRNNLYAVSSTNVRKYTENGDWLTSVMHEKISYAELIVRNVKVINQSQGFNWYINKFATKDSQGNIISKDYIGLRNWVNTYNFDKEKKEAKLFANFLNRMLLKGYEFVIVCAAGNDSHSSIGHLESEFMSWNNIISRNDYPAVYDRIIVVGSVNDQFSISSFSNVGKRTDIFAPGEKIYSTYCVDKGTHVSKPYDYLTGTSMASPHVAGVAAMVWSANNDLTGAQVKEIVCKDSNKNTRCTSCKMVDANLAVQDSFRTKGSKPSTNPDNVVAMGFVLNGDTNAAIANKTIELRSSVSSSVYTATTDKDGHYEISLPKGEYNIVAEIDNYKPFSRTVSINSDGVNYLDKILLKRIWTYEITVTDEKDNLLSGVNVVLYDSKGNKCVDINTKNGKCSFKVENSPNTTYSMWLTKEGYVWLNLQNFEINSNDNLTFKLKEDNKAKDKMYAAYLKEVKALINTYGSGKIIVDDTIIGNSFYKMTGLCYAKLIDFDNDGNEELLCVFGSRSDFARYVKVFNFDGSKANVIYDNYATHFGSEADAHLCYYSDNDKTLLLTKKKPQTYIIEEWSELKNSKFEVVKTFSESYEQDSNNAWNDVFRVDNKIVSSETFDAESQKIWANMIDIQFTRMSKSALESILNETKNTLKILGFVSSTKNTNTALELIDKSLPEISEIAGGNLKCEMKNFSVAFGTGWGTLMIYNDDTLPGLAFHPAYNSGIYQDYDENKDVIKNIKDGKYGFTGIAVYDTGKLNQSISADMTYNEIANIVGYFDCSSVAQETLVFNTIVDGHNADFYFSTENNPGLSQRINNGIVSKEDMKSFNPKLSSIAVFK